MNETVRFLIEALQNSTHHYLEFDIRDFADENHLDFQEGSSRYVLIDSTNHFVIKIAINDFGIDQNKTEAYHSGEPYVTKVLENYNDVIIVTPEYEMLEDRIHVFLNNDNYHRNLRYGDSQLNDILFDIVEDSFENLQEAINNEDMVVKLAIDEITGLLPEFPCDIHSGNFGVDFLNELDTPILIDNGIDRVFLETHDGVTSEEVFVTNELLAPLFTNNLVAQEFA